MRVLAALAFGAFLCSAATPPAFRLPAVARPIRYELELTINPEVNRFHGFSRISILFTESTRSLWLNAKDLNIERASLEMDGVSPETRVHVFDEFVEIELQQNVRPGPARIEIAYSGRLDDKTNSGLYRKSDGRDWYAFTTFTPIEARRAFPCFDEPGYKAPWRVVLHVPRSDVAASNAPTVSETDEPGAMKRVEFAETRPLASEVVAMAVGPFDVVDAGQAGAHRVPVRILAPHGRGAEAGAASAATADILARLEQYTGVPYPWEKLDHVAVLDMPYGAVENPGLITYRDRVLLGAPAGDTLERQRRMRGTMAHELAHQWFGNWVTQAWWDDVWLSEGFATWLGGRISDLELPAFERSIAAANSRAMMMQLDASATSRPVRVAMNSRADMARVYSGFVYQKGAAILNMLEQWLGPETFRRGLQTYLVQHGLSTATTDDLAAALREESGVDVSAILHSFLDQRGFPVITAEAACAVGSGDREKWTIPVCVHGDGGVAECAVLSGARKDLGMNPCPAWLWPNRGGAGYFRVQLSPSLLDSIVKSGWNQLTAPEKLSVIADTAGAVLSHQMDPQAVLNLLPAMARDPQPAVTNAAYRLLLSMMANAPAGDRTRYDEAVKKILGGPVR